MFVQGPQIDSPTQFGWGNIWNCVAGIDEVDDDIWIFHTNMKKFLIKINIIENSPTFSLYT